MSTKKSTTYGKWEIVKSLDEGGQSWTYLVREMGRVSDDVFVLKRLRNTNRIVRFCSELQACNRLSHANVVSVVDADLNAKNPYIVTAYCAFGNLATAIDRLLPKSPLEKLRLFHSICLGVGHAHAAKVIHRDLKPANIFMASDGDPRVGDWGLCLLVDADLRITGTSEAVGPRHYMAPELEDGRAEKVLPAVDVYSLGKLLYFLLTGRSFAREKHREPDYDISGTHLDFLPVYRLLDKLIAFDPKLRLTDANLVADAVCNTITYIEARARALNLVRLPSPPNETVIVSLESRLAPQIDRVTAVGLRTVGSRFEDSRAVFWGVSLESPPSTAALFDRPAPNDWVEVRFSPPFGILLPQGSMDRSLSFGLGGRPVLLLVERESSLTTEGNLTLNTVVGTRASRTLFAERVGAPRSLALAMSQSGLIAAYVGASDGERSEIVVGNDALLDRYPLPHSSNFPAPLVFDDADTLHHAIVSSRVVANREIRDLYHVSRTGDGVWNCVLVDSKPEGQTSAHIDLALSSSGDPVILTNWASSSDALVVYEWRGPGFHKRAVSLRSVLEHYALSSFDLGGEKRLAFTEDGTAHVVLSGSSPDTRDALHVAFSADWAAVASHDFILNEFLGMGFDDTNRLCLAIR